MAAPSLDLPWLSPTPREVADLLGGVTARWWLSGGAALQHWLGRPIRELPNTDVSTTARDLEQFVGALPAQLSAWVDGDDGLVPFTDADREAELQPVYVHDDVSDVWALRVNVEDGIDRAWLYRRDPRLQLPWERAVVDVDGVPTGAPEVQLVWKALRPRPEDEVDRAAVLPELTEDAVAFYETALLRIHPHSTWAIHVRSPFAPAKASWNRPGA